jgi:MoaA/NifB/PqqE/SkfB family radical SAM enzyme
VIKESASLGLKALSISGGEPTLYPHLLELVREIKKYGVSVQINSNGSLIDRQFAEELLQAGLDSAFISIYSHQAEVHNEFCRQRKLFDKATNAVRIFADLCKQYPRFQVKTQTIILRENFRYFKELIQFHQSLGTSKSSISYLEGDYDKKHILNEKEIIEFKNCVVPKALELCSKLHPSIRNKAMKRIKSIYGDKIGNPFDISRGKYWRQGSCRIPQQFTIVLANGDVHPCNIVEYTHEPIMGNLFENSFKEIWGSKRWNDFRQNLHEKCHLCPMNIHTSIPLKPEKSTFFRLLDYVINCFFL